LLGASALLVADAHRLGNLPDELPHLIIFPLCCLATLLLPNPNGMCSRLADSNYGVLGPDMVLSSWHRDCIGNCNDGVQQPDGSTLHIRFSTVVIDGVVNIEFSLL